MQPFQNLSNDLIKIEDDTIKSYFKTSNIEPIGKNDEELLLSLSLLLILDIGRRIRTARNNLLSVKSFLKEDKSPATTLEKEIEDFTKAQLNKYFPEIDFLGEESGGEIKSSKNYLAMDPIDGTWNFLSHGDTFSTAFVIVRNGTPCFSVVSNSVTGEFAYYIDGYVSRYIKMNIFNEGFVSHNLPITDNSKTLVNIHSSRYSGSIAKVFFEQWSKSNIRQVLFSGGSPSWYIVQAAKGYQVYINDWGMRPATEYDLLAATLIIRGAGGDVYDLKNQPITPIGHTGLLIAGINPTKRKDVISYLVRN